MTVYHVFLLTFQGTCINTSRVVGTYWPILETGIICKPLGAFRFFFHFPWPRELTLHLRGPFGDVRGLVSLLGLSTMTTWKQSVLAGLVALTM